MTYFFVIPAFLAWLTAGTLALLALRFKATSWRGRPYASTAFIWASVGVLLANALLVAGLYAGAALLPAATQAEQSAQTVFGYLWGALAILGPLFVSALGWFVGLIVGLLVAHKRVSAMPPNPSIERTCPGKPGQAAYVERYE